MFENVILEALAGNTYWNSDFTLYRYTINLRKLRRVCFPPHKKQHINFNDIYVYDYIPGHYILFLEQIQ